MSRLVVLATLLALALPQGLHAVWGEVDPGFGANGWLQMSWSGVFGPIPTALNTDTQDRVITAVDTGSSTVKFLRTFDNGAVDTSFGFLGGVSITVPGASDARIVRLLPSVGDSLIAIGDAELTDGHWIVVFLLQEDGSLVEDEFGVDGFVFTRGGLTNVEAFAADAEVNGGGELLEIVGWADHAIFGVELGLRVILDLDAGGELESTTTSSIPTSSERWLRIAGAGTGAPCHSILAERDGTVRLFGYTTGLSPVCGTPAFSLQLSLPAAPAATLRAASLAAAPGGDLVAALWVESGLLTKPTAFFRTAGKSAALRPTWGTNGIAYVDTASAGWIGYRSSRLVIDWWTGDVFSIGEDLGTGGLFGTVHRVRATRLMGANGALDPTVPVTGVTSPDTNRHHQVRDVAFLVSSARPVAAVSSHLTDGFDVPKAWLVAFQSGGDLLSDGFESGSIESWSSTTP